MSAEDIWTIPGWGLAFAMWALAALAGTAIVLASVLAAWRARRKREAGER